MNKAGVTCRKYKHKIVVVVVVVDGGGACETLLCVTDAARRAQLANYFVVGTTAHGASSLLPPSVKRVNVQPPAASERPICTINLHFRTRLKYHRLNGSSSPVLTATCLSYGSLCDFLTFFSPSDLEVTHLDRF